jgi:hypothetical protein
MNDCEATRALATKKLQELNVAYSGRASVREREKLPVLAICSRQYITFGAERSLKEIHTAQDNNHFPSLKMTVFNVGFHKALEIP